CGEKFPDDANFCPMDASKLVLAGQASSPLPPPPVPPPRPAAASPAATAASGPVGGRFVLGAKLGGGLSGEVYRAHDNQTNTPVALKLINAAVVPSPIAVERASRELRQLARLSSDRIARVVDFGKNADGRLFVASELVDGQPLDKI